MGQAQRTLLVNLRFYNHVQKCDTFCNSCIDIFKKQLSFKVFSFKSCNLANKPDVVELFHEAVKDKLGETNKARVSYCCSTFLIIRVQLTPISRVLLSLALYIQSGQFCTDCTQVLIKS